jgi:hypothetical protein
MGNREHSSTGADEELALLAIVGLGMADEWPAPFELDAADEVSAPIGEVELAADDEAAAAAHQHSHEGRKEHSVHG